MDSETIQHVIHILSVSFQSVTSIILQMMITLRSKSRDKKSLDSSGRPGDFNARLHFSSSPIGRLRNINSLSRVLLHLNINHSAHYPRRCQYLPSPENSHIRDLRSRCPQCGFSRDQPLLSPSEQRITSPQGQCLTWEKEIWDSPQPTHVRARRSGTNRASDHTAVLGSIDDLMTSETKESRGQNR
ncbi:hypothetical protein GE09DRAFT_483238 [Coniochaeta sp. 2T2.1]|nr:hypothetical protein GE09DRAFT_483238 [Coniochaeta sp. 2T2.1]